MKKNRKEKNEMWSWEKRISELSEKEKAWLVGYIVGLEFCIQNLKKKMEAKK